MSLALEATDEGKRVFVSVEEPARISRLALKRRKSGDALVARLWSDPGILEVSVVTAKDALTSVRQRAEGWRNGVAASLGLVFATMTVKGPEDGIGAFSGGEQQVLIALLTFSIALALGSLYKILRAAHGPSWLDAHFAQVSHPYDAQRYLKRAGGAAYDLRCGQSLWLAALVVFFITVVLVWVL